MFSEMNNLLTRDKLHIAKLRKISKAKVNLSRKNFVHKKNYIVLFSKYS